MAKTSIVQFRVSEEELKKLENRASLNNMTLTEYAKRRLVDENNLENKDYSNLTNYDRRMMAMSYRNYKYLKLLAIKLASESEINESVEEAEALLRKRKLID